LFKKRREGLNGASRSPHTLAIGVSEFLYGGSAMGKLTYLAAVVLVCAPLVGCKKDKPNEGTTGLPHPGAHMTVNTTPDPGPVNHRERS
jgi:hypothetical protein